MTSPATITVPEAAARLGISERSYYRAVKRGDVPAIHIGRRLLVPEIQLEALIRTGDWRAA